MTMCCVSNKQHNNEWRSNRHGCGVLSPPDQPDDYPPSISAQTGLKGRKASMLQPTTQPPALPPSSHANIYECNSMVFDTSIVTATVT
mmetsp:Transcript_67349/g.119415  ORF Transcript_67349/g.119415 Transcript_67349/m.119415 type:complete len:88 (-) Transcript_67349:798-1061(-)